MTESTRSAVNPSKLSGARPADIDHMRWLGEHKVLGAEGWQGKSLLDLGCGSGFICAEAARQGARHVVGVDLKQPDVGTDAWHFCSVDLEGDSWPSLLPKAAKPHESFDLILAFDILEHLSAPAKFLAGCRSLLSPSGRLVLTTPNTASWERWLRGEQWSGATDPQHKVLFSRYSLGFLMRRSGLEPLVLDAPVRKLAKLGIPCPQVGAQIVCISELVHLTVGG